MSDAAVISAVVGAVVSMLFIRLRALDRRLNRLSLLDAKVDALLKHAGIQFDPLGDVPPDVRDALQRGETILAIRRIRQATGASLKEAKALVDDIRRRTVDSVIRP